MSSIDQRPDRRMQGDADVGFGGVRVSDAETATLRDISKALGMAS